MSPVSSCVDERLPALLRAVSTRFGQSIPERRLGAFRTAVLEAYVASGTKSFEEYEKRIAGDPLESALIADLLGRITIKESYFFRDEAVMSALREVVLPRLVARNSASRQLSIWSAGCANGEEPYSLSILMDQVLRTPAEWTIRIVGTDVDEGALRLAALGHYGEWSVRGVPHAVREQCFEAKAGKLRVRDRHRRWVRFEAHNLVDEGSTAPVPGSFDLVLCRNVGIYLSDDAAATLYRKLGQALCPHGILVTAPSDPAPPPASGLLPTLLRTRSHTTLVYALHPLGLQPSSRAPRSPAVPSQPSEPSVAASGAPPSFAPPVAREVSPAPSAAAEAPAATDDSLDPATYFMLALAEIDASRHDRAEALLRKALYLSPAFAEAHYRLGLLLARRGEFVAGRRSLLTALRVVRHDGSSPTWAASIGAQLAWMERNR